MASTKEVAVVDDMPLMRDLLRRIIDRLDGVSMSWEAGDGIEALELIGESPPSILIVDLLLPSIGGEEVISAVRRRYARDEVAIIVLTGALDRLRSEACLEAGADICLQKGGRIDDLKRAILSLAGESAGCTECPVTVSPWKASEDVLEALHSLAGTVGMLSAAIELSKDESLTSYAAEARRTVERWHSLLEPKRLDAESKDALEQLGARGGGGDTMHMPFGNTPPHSSLHLAASPGVGGLAVAQACAYTFATGGDVTASCEGRITFRPGGLNLVG